MTERYERLQLDMMGGFFDFQRGWWEPHLRDETTDRFYRVFDRLNEKGIRDINFFTNMYDGTVYNAHYEEIVPWQRAKKPGEPFILRIKPKYLESYDAWCRLLKSTNHFPIRCDWMWGYSFLPFKFNVMGIRDFCSEPAWEYIEDFSRTLNRIEHEVFGDGYRIKVRPMNEPRHYGDDKALHYWADWHERYFLECLRPDRVELRDLYIDSSLSEGAHAQFVPDHACPKCTTRRFGSNRFLMENGRIQINVINHGYSIPEDVGYGFNRWAKSDLWRRPAELWLGGDGGAQQRELAKGHKLLNAHGHVVWAQGDAKQTNALIKKAFKIADKYNHKAGYQITCFEIFQGYPWVEHFSIDTIDWSRINAAINAHKSVLGG